MIRNRQSHLTVPEEAEPPAGRAGITRYENRLLLILGLGGAVAALDAQALFYLSPFVAMDLGLSNAQIGVVASVVLLSWSVSGYAIGSISDRTGRRKAYLVAAFALFALCSFFSGFARSFAVLFAARVLIGCAEGPVIPLSQSIMVRESAPHRRGFNMGIVQNFGAQLIGSLVGPIVLVKLATAIDWHVAFYVAGIPGLIVAALVAVFVNEPQVDCHAGAPVVEGSSAGRQFVSLFGFHNIRVCVLISCCVVAWYFLLLTFLPLYCVRALGFSPSNMSLVMGGSGAAGVVSAFLVPGLSDRFGRRRVMMLFTLGGVIAPLAPLFMSGTLALLVALVFAGSLTLGTAPLFMATIPLETVPERDAAAATGLIMGLGQIIGGFAGPALGGLLADRYDLSIPLWIAVAAALMAALLSTRLQETAPRVNNDARRARLLEISH